MTSSATDYQRLLRQALRGMLRDLLRETADTGLPSGHELYFTVRTDRPGVELPEATLAEYPEEITIVLRNKTYDGLVVDDDAFRLTLQFSGVPARVRVPFAALLRFADPAAEFALDLGPTEVDGSAPSQDGTSETAETAGGRDDDGASESPNAGSNVVSFTSRRRR